MLMLMSIRRKEVKLQQRARSRRWVGTSFQLRMVISPPFAPAGAHGRGFPDTGAPTHPSPKQISPVETVWRRRRTEPQDGPERSCLGDALQCPVTRCERLTTAILLFTQHIHAPRQAWRKPANVNRETFPFPALRLGNWSVITSPPPLGQETDRDGLGNR